MTNNIDVAFLDIETFPNLGYTWGKWEQNVIAFEREWTMASYAVKWMGEKTIDCKTLPDFKTYQKDPFDDTELTHSLWEVFNRADIIIAHNGDNFDIKMTMARFLLNGEPPPRPFNGYDTLKKSRKIFGKGMNSHKLDDLCSGLGIGRKLRHEGKEMWLRCLQQDEVAWNKMRRYNTHDIKLLEGLYYHIRPWDTTHPNLYLATNEAYLCPVCGSNKVVSDGPRYCKAYTVDRWYCKTCTHYSSGARRKIPVQVLS